MITETVYITNGIFINKIYEKKGGGALFETPAPLVVRLYSVYIYYFLGSAVLC